MTENPYPSTADRPVSFSEMVYHIGLVRDEVHAVKDCVEAVRDLVEEERREQSLALRWRWGIAATLVMSFASVVGVFVPH